MNKSIQLLLLISLVYLGFCSCLFWTGISLTLKQSYFYFLFLLLILASICTFIHYLSVHNHVSSHLRNPSRSFFFLFGLDIATFLPLNKWRKLPTHKKTGRLTTLIFLSLFFLHNPLTIFSVSFYILLGVSFLNFLFPKTLRQDLSFYSHLIRNILLVLSTLMFW